MKSFLRTIENPKLKENLKLASKKLKSDQLKHFSSGSDFSKILIQKLEDQFSQDPLWNQILPIALGSWARGELCLGSDLDMIFLGPENLVSQFIQKQQQAGIKIRARVPEDINDWTKGVELFDLLALLQVKTFHPQSQELYLRQLEKIVEIKFSSKKKMLRQLYQERVERNKRYDSITNFLEPNLKFGPGGLRDLGQAISVLEFLKNSSLIEKIPPHNLNVLNYYKELWLLIRHLLHLENHGDILNAQAQLSIAQDLKYEGIRDFMRDVQKGLSRVHFYSEAIFAHLLSSRSDILYIQKIKLNKPQDILKNFEDLERKKFNFQKRILLQEKIRQEAKKVFDASSKKEIDLANIKFKNLIQNSKRDQTLTAVFQSRFVDRIIPDFRNIVGLVQHDQYHRMSVDAHLLQCIRECKRVRSQPKLLGDLKKQVSSLEENDWIVLIWTSLFHDLAKGQKSVLNQKQNHSDLGVQMALKYLNSLSIPKKLQQEVLWLIENHLLISEAAFKKNPEDKETLKYLWSRKLTKKRAILLTVFTALDIRATNIDAWNSWKSKLLSRLLNRLISKDVQAFENWIRIKDSLGSKLSTDIILSLDPFLDAFLKPKLLIQDLDLCSSYRIKSKKQQTAEQNLKDMIHLNIKTHPLRKDSLLIRMHVNNDKEGMFYLFVSILSEFRLSIQHASIVSADELGVYDWFEVKSKKNLKLLVKDFLKSGFCYWDGSTRLLLDLDHYKNKKNPTPAVLETRIFEKIELIEQSEYEWVFIFTGRDQAGMLLISARALYELGLDIKWAKVHTWGRQVQDQFCVRVKKDMNLDQILGLLQKKLLKF